MRKVMLILVACALVLLSWSATASAHSKARPFKGSMSGTCTFAPDAASPTGMWTLSDATGTASHMGVSVMTAKHPSDFNFSDGHMTLVAANGDEVRIEYFGGGPMPPAVGDWYDIWVDATIVGGTGRFAHASGAADMTVSLQFMGFDVFVWPAVFTWHGTIRY